MLEILFEFTSYQNKTILNKRNYFFQTLDHFIFLSGWDDLVAQFPWRKPHSPPIMIEKFRSTVSVEETSFTPYHIREIPKHSFRGGDLIHPLSCQRDSEAQFPWRRPHSPPIMIEMTSITPIMSERFRSTVSVEETLFTPYHVREIPKHTFRWRPHSPPIISERFRSTLSVGNLIHPLSYQTDSEAQFPSKRLHSSLPY